MLERGSHGNGIETSRFVITRRVWRWAIACLIGPALCVAAGAVPAVAHQDLELQIADLTLRIESDPDDAGLYLRRGELHRLHEEWSAALKDYERARGLDPGLATLDFSLGKLRLDSDEPQAARPPLERYLSHAPGDVQAHVLLARALFRLDRPLASAEAYDRAVALSVEQGRRPAPEVFVGRAEAWKQAGAEHLAHALHGLEQGIELLGGPVVLELEAVELEHALGRTDDALSRLDRLAAGSARKETWLVRRGEVLEEAGRLAEARQAYEAALVAFDSLPENRRKVRALARIKSQATAALERLGTGRLEPTQRIGEHE